MCPDISSQLAPGSARSVAQAVVDSVVVLLESGAFGSPLPGSPANGDASPAAQGNLAAAASQPAAAASASGETAALRFLAAHLASNRAVVSGTVLLRVLGHLAQPQQAAAGTAPGPDGERPADEQQAGFRAAGQQEAAAVPAGGEQQILSMPADQQEAVSMTADEREAVFCDVIAAAAGGLGPADRQQVGGGGEGVRACSVCPGSLEMQLCCMCCLHDPTQSSPSSAAIAPVFHSISFICVFQRRRCTLRGGRASCELRRECGMQRGCMARRWHAWRGMPGAVLHFEVGWCCISFGLCCTQRGCTARRWPAWLETQYEGGWQWCICGLACSLNLC